MRGIPSSGTRMCFLSIILILGCSGGDVVGPPQVTIVPGDINLEFTTQPTNQFPSTRFEGVVAVSVVDDQGILIPVDTGSVTLAIAAGAGTTGANLTGTVAASFSDGKAEFTDLSVDLAGPGYQLSAQVGGVPRATSASFDVRFPDLAFETQPGTTQAGATMSTITVLVSDAGAPLESFSGVVGLAITPETGSPSAFLSGVGSGTASGGVVTFSNLRVSLAGTGYTLDAMVGGQVLATSGTFDVAARTSSGTRQDLTQLPVASGQVPMYAAYDALNVPAMSAGSQYSDPLTGVLVTKITDSGTPVGNSSSTHSYSNGPLQISQPWGPDSDMYTLKVLLPDGAAGWLVDYQLGGTLTNWRAAPGGDLTFTFSTDPSTPQIAYFLAGTTLNRYNTATNSVENTGNFPVSGQGRAWLQQDANDEWFVSATTTTAFAFNRVTGASLTLAGGSGFDEPYFEHGGRYVFLVRNSGTFPGPFINTVWDLSTNTSVEYGSSVRMFHGTSLFGYWTGQDVDTGGDAPTVMFRADDGSQSVGYLPGGYNANYHDSGQWLQPTVPQTEQYYLKSLEAADGRTSNYQGSNSLVRLDGADTRILNHHYTGRTGSTSYFQTARSTIGPDGLLVMFTSDMNRSGSRGDLFIAEIPRR